MPEQVSAQPKPVKLQYWSSSHAVGAPDGWPEPYEFATVADAVAFAMTQSPANRELAWIRTEQGEVLKPEQIYPAGRFARGRTGLRIGWRGRHSPPLAAKTAGGVDLPASSCILRRKIPASGSEASGPRFGV